MFVENHCILSFEIRYEQRDNNLRFPINLPFAYIPRVTPRQWLAPLLELITSYYYSCRVSGCVLDLHSVRLCNHFVFERCQGYRIGGKAILVFREGLRFRNSTDDVSGNILCCGGTIYNDPKRIYNILFYLCIYSVSYEFYIAIKRNLHPNSLFQQ